MLSSERGLYAIESFLADCYRSFAALPGGAVLETGEISGVINDIPVPFFNGVGRSQLHSDIEESIERVVDPFRRRGRAFRWWISPATRPAGLETVLQRRGFQHVYDAGGMAADLSNVTLEEPAPAGTVIELVETRQELQQWAEILLHVFQRPHDEIGAWIDAYQSLAGRSQWAHFLGSWNGHPAATASVLVSGGRAGVYHVATLPAARGRGLGAALTRETMRWARAAGATEIILQSSEMGASVYRAVGFVRYCDLRLYAWYP